MKCVLRKYVCIVLFVGVERGSYLVCFYFLRILGRRRCLSWVSSCVSGGSGIDLVGW